MAQDKKDIDYWDKYYNGKKEKSAKSMLGSSNASTRKASSYKPANRTSGSNRRSNSSAGRYKAARPYQASKHFHEDYEARIVGSEYKVKKKKKRSGISRVITITILIVVIFFLGFFTFYALDNDLFGKKPANLNSAAAAKDNSAKTGSTESDDIYTESASTAEPAASPSETTNTAAGTSKKKEAGFWQKIVLFFKTAAGKQDPAESYPERLSLNIYFVLLGDEEKFNAEKRTIAAGSIKNAATNAVNELLKGPFEAYNFAVIPPGTKLLNVEIINDMAQIDLSQEFLTNSLDTSILDEYIVYTIVDTLTEIKEIRAVTFFIDGKEIKEYGSVDLRLPAIRNEKYLEKS